MIIQGEFIKDYSLILENKFTCQQINISGIKVLIPYELELGNIKEIKVTELYSTFSKEMILSVESSEI